MAEQSPAPTASRSIYGFVVYLLFSTLFITYVLWAFIPLELYERSFGITDGVPNKYFALFLPLIVLTGTAVFAFFIYPSFSFMMTPTIDSINTVTDKSSIKRCQHFDAVGALCDNKIQRDVYATWTVDSECDSHQKKESRVSNHCDCTNKRKCMLACNSDHIETLRKQENQIQNSADLDIFFVNQVLYGRK